MNERGKEGLRGLSSNLTAPKEQSLIFRLADNVLIYKLINK